MFRMALVVLSLTGSLTLQSVQVVAQSTESQREEVSKAKQRAITFLKTTQANDGSWTSPESPGISGLITYSLLISGVPKTDPTMEKALKHLSSHVQPDGGIYFAKSNHHSYETAISLLAFEAANKDGQYSSLIKNAEKVIRKLQWG